MVFPIQPDPLVIIRLREFKLALLAQEQGVLEEMAARWVQVEKSLEAEINGVVYEVAALAENGEMPDAAKLAKLQRYQRLMWQLRAGTADYVNWADEKITAQQASLGEQGLQHAVQAIRAVYIGSGAVSPNFDVLPVDAINTLIGLAGDGSPLINYLRQIHGQAANGLTQALIDGMAKGLNPSVVAQQMVDGFGIGLQTAMNTARTETLRAYRLSSLMQYNASGVVNGYKRLAAHDGRACIGCLFTEGEFYESLGEFDEHNQGRCTPVPVVAGVQQPNWLSGTDWFLTQNEETQQSIMGSGRFEAWKNGADLADMVKRVSDPVWGGAFIPTPVNELP